jgi:hypothetical protein
MICKKTSSNTNEQSTEESVDEGCHCSCGTVFPVQDVLQDIAVHRTSS